MARKGDRASHCKHGHKFTPENTRLQVSRGATYQSCRTCQRESQGRQRELGYFEEYQLQRRYGMSIEDRDRLLTSQGGVCALCDRPAVTVDHDHTTGEVRGMLCRGCNVAIGVLGDSPVAIQRVLDYMSGPRLQGVV